MPFVDNKLLRQQASPLDASINWDPQLDTDQESVSFCEEFLKLPQKIRYGLINPEISKNIFSFAKEYNFLEPKKVGELSRIVREIFTRGIREDEIKKRLAEKIGLAPYDVEHILIDLRQLVALVKKIGEEDYKRTFEQISLNEALKKYEKLGEQWVGQGLIQLKVFPQPVQPSIKNWLEDYFSYYGTNKHNTLERSDFLFKTSNAKKLDSTDRDNLAIILKSYDTGQELVINVEDQEIIFSESQDLEEKFHSKLERDLASFQPEREQNLPEPKQNVAATMPSKAAIPSVRPEDNIIIKGETYNSVKTPQLKPTLKTLPKEKAKYLQQDVPVDLSQKKATINERLTKIIRPINPLPSQTNNDLPQANEPLNLKDLPQPPKPNQNASKNVVDLSEYM